METENKPIELDAYLNHWEKIINAISKSVELNLVEIKLLRAENEHLKNRIKELEDGIEVK